MATDTRERLLDSARRRFYRDGFRNVGIDQILDDVGISKTAFYNHFESKDALMVAVLEAVDQWLQQQFRVMVRQRGGPAAGDQLRVLLDVVREVIESEEFHGCIFVNAAMEFPLAHDPVHEAAVRHKQAIEALIHELAERAGAADPQALAREMGLVIEGLYVTRMLTGDPAAIDIAQQIAGGVIARHLPPNGERSRSSDRRR